MTDVVFGWIIPAIHVLACLFLIVVVLLQTGKGADMGAVFGGGSQTLFGSGGAGNFLTRLTTATAIIFMVTSLVLTYGLTPTKRSGILDKLPEPAAPVETAPDAPAADAGAPAETPLAVAPEAGQPTGTEPAPAAPPAAPAGGTPPADAAKPAAPAPAKQ